MTDQPIMEFTSHVAGANARVAIYPDRIEWSRKGYKPAGGAKAAILTSGLSLALPGRRDTNMIPVRMIQGVTTHRAGLSYTTVKVATAGDVTEFRVTKSQAEQVRQLLLQLMSGTAPAGSPAPQAYPPVPVPSPPASASLADELRKLAELRDAGVLTEAEFDAQKARLLG
jgi:Short C-terminal domain